jgi:hypothetical protein
MGMKFMMILFVKLTKGIGHKFYQLMKSSPIMGMKARTVIQKASGQLNIWEGYRGAMPVEIGLWLVEDQPYSVNNQPK